MSIKGYPSNQKLPLGSGITNNFVTIQPSDEYRTSLDAGRFAFRVGGDVAITAESSTGNIDGRSWIYDTSTTAKVGDFIRFATGSNAYLEVSIVLVETNRFMLGALLSTAPASGDTFYIMRSTTQRVDSTGNPIVAVSNAPIQFALNGTDTDVSQDTGTPASSNPLPIIPLNVAGTEFDSIGTFGALTESAPATDTASSGLNGRLQRIAQRLSSLITKLAAFGTAGTASADVLTVQGVASMTALVVDGSGVTQPVSGTFWQATQPVSGTFWQATQPISGTITTNSIQRSKVNIVRNDYGSINVTSSAYVELIASTAAASTVLEIFDSSGQTLVLAVGAAASEVDQFYINPGGNGRVELNIPIASRVSIKAVTATASAGYINLNLYS